LFNRCFSWEALLALPALGGESCAVNENVGLVSAGLDPATNKYIGREAVIKAQIARVRADKKMSAVDKKEKLADLNDQFQFALPAVQYKANIDLVAKYSGALAKTMRGD
jgi:hypothetical protein